MRSNGYNIWGFLGWIKTAAQSWNTEKLKNLFFKNLGKKVLAVAFAIALWFSANIEQDVEKSVSIDVNYVNLPADLVIMNEPPETLNLRIRGPRTQLSSLSPHDIAFAFDLANASPGVSKFEIHTDQIEPPRGIQIIGISPAEVRIDIDKMIEKEVKVKPTVGLPDTGYEIVGEPRVIPSEARIRGPKRIVSQIESISTDLVSTSGVKSSFTLEVPLRANSRVEIVGGGFARVTVNVEEKIVVKEFNDMDISLLNFDGQELQPQGPLKAKLVFEGPYSIIKNLNSDDIEVSVDAGNLKQNTKQKTQRLRVNVNYPYKGSLTLKKKVPEEIEVRLK